jgi:2,4-didehydro-3-deoxy-L-rhamnonate hydrolase
VAPDISSHDFYRFSAGKDYRMKLLRYGPANEEKPGLLDDKGDIRDLSDHVDDIHPATLTPDRLAMLNSIDPATLPLIKGSTRLGSPVTGVGKILAIGLNYADHIKETGSDLPPEPLIFSKAVTCLCGPDDNIIIPKGSTSTDYEVELAVIIGTRGLYIEKKDAIKHIAGYAVMNDVSEREYQKNRGGQWIKGKSFDSFGPLGPWLVTADEISDPGDLDLWCDVNSDRRQDSNTKNLIFDVATLIEKISQYMTLMPGDIITTGTPSGVGLGRTPPEFLKPGDVVELGIEGLGQQRHDVRAWLDD